MSTEPTYLERLESYLTDEFHVGLKSSRKKQPLTKKKSAAKKKTAAKRAARKPARTYVTVTNRNYGKALQGVVLQE